MSDIFDIKRSGQDSEPVNPVAASATLGGTRAQTVQRLQVGLVGLATMVLLVGLASIINDRASESEAARVPEASATMAPSAIESPKSDPLVDAGVVPDLPLVESGETPDTQGPVLPEQGKNVVPD
ncbi:hypothetical protein [Altererythrobacter aquiaggeris]|uniref:hypothetical protein n=1 Tax=Aestuarierythrobacter aquiaggeris TaxID=1898396 RepID=UPI003016CAAC